MEGYSPSPSCQAGFHQIVKLLVGADPSCPQEPNGDNETPLYLAAESECEASVLAILDDCDSSALDYAHKGPCGLTALHLLVQWNTTGILIKKILDKDESVVRIQDDTGSTPLHWAAASNKAKQLSVLLSYDKNTNESAAYMKDNDGLTPLLVAALNYNLNCIKELLSSRPDCMDVVDSKGQNVLHYAANWASIKKLEHFLRDFDHQHRLGKLFNSRDLSGETPLHLVAAYTPRMTCGCKQRVRNFLKLQQQYLKSFNKDNLTVGEIVDSHIYPPEGIIQRYLLHNFGVWESVERLAPMCRRMKDYRNSKDARRKVYKEELGKVLAELKKVAKSELIVAALVATVSFTAGFTLPGGFDQKSGMAVLANSDTFKYFVGVNTLALLLSSLAVVYYFVAAGTSKALLKGGVIVHKIARFFTMLSTIAMILAFVVGLSSVLPRPLVILVWNLFGSFMMLLGITIWLSYF